jgi:uncharacterized membrane protein
MFVRAVIHIMFDDNLMDLDKNWGTQFDKNMSYIIVGFSVFRVIAIALILTARMKTDMLTYILYYLGISAILRIYLEYLELVYDKTKVENSEFYRKLDLFLDYQAIVVCLSCGFIIKYVFF